MSNKIPLWTPSQSRKDASRLTAFVSELRRDGYNIGETYEELHKFSIQEKEIFWSKFWDFAGIMSQNKGVAIDKTASDMISTRFFPEAKLNYAQNLLRKNDDTDAIIFQCEGDKKSRLSWRHLNAHVAKIQAAMQACGLKEGDRVAAVVPNLPQTVVSMLAATATGAIWSSCSPDFGVQGILDRISQIDPTVLVVVDGYEYNRKIYSIVEKIAEVVKALPTLKAVIVIPYTNNATDMIDALKSCTVCMNYDEIINQRAEETPCYASVPFNHPLFILYSSGTTGMPKCIVHGTGGTLIQHMKEHALQSDIKAGDRVFYFTTCGWMMWNWLVSALAQQATLLLYEGSPFAPSGNVLFNYAQEEGMTFFGTSAKYIDSLKKFKFKPQGTHDLRTLRTMASTGSPLSDASFEYVYEAIKNDIHLASISGGTDIVSCFVLGNPWQSVFTGEIQCRGLGMDVDVYTDDATPCERGQKGELVCKSPFPSMPVMFWNDPDAQKYHAAYFERFEGIWAHGDFAEKTAQGGIIIHGRSDATLNPGGVRIGTAEIYAQVEKSDEVLESIAIGQPWKDDVRIILFVKMKDGFELTDDLKTQIKENIKTGASPRHVPALIIAIPDIPRTKSGKITEIAVRDTIAGKPIKNVEALQNPEALAHYQNLKELQ